MERVKRAFMQVKPRDILAPLIFLLMVIPSLFFRLINKIKHRKLWLVAEQGEARDNGYHFYKYVREKHPKDFCFYAIKPESAGYKKVEKLGNVIKWGSLKHWLYYMSANLNISSQKSGNPAPIFWYVAHVKLGLYRNRVFLQHGVIMNNLKWLYYKKTRFRYFIASTASEYREINTKYGYPDGSVILTGLSRWDDYYKKDGLTDKKMILVMPTWRKYLGVQNNALFDNQEFTESSYYRAWNDFLNNNDLVDYIEDNDIRICFYPHQNVQKMISAFTVKSNNIRIVSISEDISKYLFECAMMITDYSSAMFDVAYLGKPVLYYQFDRDDFFEKQYNKGYFDYSKDGFGPVTTTEKALIDSIKRVMEHGQAKQYQERTKSFFSIRDNRNSERIYTFLRNDHRGGGVKQ